MVAEGKYEAVIGLEVHAQLRTRTKMFCGCRTDYGLAPNSEVCPVCLGLPGALPVANSEAIRLAVRAAISLGARVNPQSTFARKNYFYPDLPKGYQISQHEHPLAEDGMVTLRDRGEETSIRIERLHLEEDAGKSMHLGLSEGSGIDFNRCGIPLVEIVSAPVIASPRLAHLYLVRLKQVLEYAGVSSGSMELGALRCDANVSVRPRGEQQLGIKAELKNLNSFKNVERALAYEIDRQTALREQGGRVMHETLFWDADRQISVLMRSKEEENDYRYFPEPDLVPLCLEEGYLETQAADLPELPHDRERRFVTQLGLPEYDAGVLVGERALADFFEEAARLAGDAKAASNWIMTEVLKAVNDRKLAVWDLGVGPRDVADLLGMIGQRRISGKMAKQVFEEMVRTGRPPLAIVEERGLAQLSDREELRRIVRQVVEANPSSIQDLRKGKTRAFRFLVGKVMEATGGKANPEIARDMLEEELAT
jgi:aspartyl-tRNA(Asn)/glutamyl-tRNA(Gln) amidotransferase subunit B